MKKQAAAEKSDSVCNTPAQEPACITSCTEPKLEPDTAQTQHRKAAQKSSTQTQQQLQKRHNLMAQSTEMDIALANQKDGACAELEAHPALI